MKVGGGKRKGGAYERVICKDLSIWWSNNPDKDDIFYRTASSGGRATVRNKKNKATYGAAGDITSLDPIGKPLTDLCTLECKDGYPGQSPFDLIDPPRKLNSKYGEFFSQCIEESKQAGTPYWMLIARRKGKVSMIYLPYSLYKALKRVSRIHESIPNVRLCFPKDGAIYRVFGTTLTQFFQTVRPNQIEKLAKGCKNGTSIKKSDE